MQTPETAIAAHVEIEAPSISSLVIGERESIESKVLSFLWVLSTSVLSDNWVTSALWILTESRMFPPSSGIEILGFLCTEDCFLFPLTAWMNKLKKSCFITLLILLCRKFIFHKDRSINTETIK